VGPFKYLRAAFTQRWNLLAFLGALALASIAPFPPPDVTIPLIFAAEIAYLGFLGTHPKFQKYVEAQEAKAARSEGTHTAEQTRMRILGALPRPTVERFESLRGRCRELRQLAAEMRDPHHAVPGASPRPLEDMQLAGLDKLLWIYLKLLFTQHSLDRFVKQTDEGQIRDNVRQLERRLGEIPEDAEGQRQRMRKALTDNLETSKTRLANFQKAQDNRQLVELEIDRLENKIRAISEMAVNRHEPEFISGQVDEVASSMVQTERTMSELDFLTGLDAADEAVPPMMRDPQKSMVTQTR
jgi:hypothetical protein